MTTAQTGQPTPQKPRGIVMIQYESQETLREAREKYFAKSGFDQTTYIVPWSRVKVGPIAWYVPNTPMRKRALPLHDLHHIATGYGTTLFGEAEISAWEVGSGGLGKYPSGWPYVLGLIVVGLLLNPRATINAYRRGRSCTNLFWTEFKAEFLSKTVGDLRSSLGIQKLT